MRNGTQRAILKLRCRALEINESLRFILLLGELPLATMSSRRRGIASRSRMWNDADSTVPKNQVLCNNFSLLRGGIVRNDFICLCTFAFACAFIFSFENGASIHSIQERPHKSLCRRSRLRCLDCSTPPALQNAQSRKIHRRQ